MRGLLRTLPVLFVTALIAGAVVYVLTFVFHVGYQSPQSPSPDYSRYVPMRAVPPMAPITEFPIKKVAEAPTTGDNALNPDELVLGVTINGESRAYPINMLTGPQREILNDTLGGKAIAATW